MKSFTTESIVREFADYAESSFTEDDDEFFGTSEVPCKFLKVARILDGVKSGKYGKYGVYTMLCERVRPLSKFYRGDADAFRNKCGTGISVALTLGGLPPTPTKRTSKKKASTCPQKRIPRSPRSPKKMPSSSKKSGGVVTPNRRRGRGGYSRVDFRNDIDNNTSNISDLQTLAATQVQGLGDEIQLRQELREDHDELRGDHEEHVEYVEENLHDLRVGLETVFNHLRLQR